MSDKPLYAPGCFGLFWTFKKEDTICASCPYAGQCEQTHNITVDRVRDFYGIKTPNRIKSGLPVKVKKVFEELGKSEQEVSEAMKSGQNPYSVKDGFVGVVCHLIIHAGEITRSALEATLAAHRKLSPETASVYTRQALQILTHCGAVAFDGKSVKLERG